MTERGAPPASEARSALARARIRAGPSPIGRVRWAASRRIIRHPRWFWAGSDGRERYPRRSGILRPLADASDEPSERSVS